MDDYSDLLGFDTTDYSNAGTAPDSAQPMMSPYPDASGVTGGTPDGMVNPYPANYGGGAAATLSGGIDPATMAYLGALGISGGMSAMPQQPNPMSAQGGAPGQVQAAKTTPLTQPTLMPTTQGTATNYSVAPWNSNAKIGQASSSIAGLMAM